MRRNFAWAALIALLIAGSVSGCSWSQEWRRPLVVQDMARQLPTYPDTAVVYFEEAIPTKPLLETVWDNVTGVFWDAGESKQIGYTRNYSGVMILPLPIGVAATMRTHTRIVMPFGRSFAEVFESALRKSFSKYFMCYDNSCLTTSTAQNGHAKVLRIKIESFATWEDPRNYLNLYAKGLYIVMNDDGTAHSEYQFKKSILKSRMGNVFNTHDSIIDTMNDLLNELSADLTAEIITKSFTQNGTDVGDVGSK
jgi:hypothetical protein